jgi:Coenzyme PQQ synthesis protein D (PqqD)
VVSSTYAIHERQISHNRFDDEVVVVNLSSGSYFSLHETAAEIWNILQAGPASAQSIAAAFRADDAHTVQEIGTFLEQLAREDLIVPCEAPARSAGTDTIYSAPALEAFNELRELLLADIVHDTDEAGWPHLASAKPIE